MYRIRQNIYFLCVYNWLQKQTMPCNLEIIYTHIYIFYSLVIHRTILFHFLFSFLYTVRLIFIDTRRYLLNCTLLEKVLRIKLTFLHGDGVSRRKFRDFKPDLWFFKSDENGACYVYFKFSTKKSINTLTATPKSHVSLRMPREYFYYSKHIIAK